MLFHSYAFILAFLPSALAGFLLLNRFAPQYQKHWLIAASLLFYGYWSAPYVLLVVGSAAFNFWISGLMIAQPSETGRRRLLWGGVAANLLLLGYYKYTNFFISNVEHLTTLEIGVQNIVLPIGISFFTFQQIAFLADSAAGKVNERNPGSYLLFVTFFPQLIAGPIVHHKEMMPQFAQRIASSEMLPNIALGLLIFTLGLFKKVVLADGIAPQANLVFDAADAGESVELFTAWWGVLAYTFQIYFDFSGYTDMAIGAAQMFGIRLPLNFDSPYQSKSIVEFWRTWHMTLSRFLRDYLYIPLGGNRRGQLARYRNLVITMVLGGLWHGAAWGFVIWGALHGLYLLVAHLLEALGSPVRRLVGARASGLVGWAATFFAVAFAWTFFRATTLDGALRIAGGLLGGGGADWDTLTTLLSSPIMFGVASPVVLFAVALYAPNSNRIADFVRDAIERDDRRLMMFAGLVTGIALMLALVFVGDDNEFLYFQF